MLSLNMTEKQLVVGGEKKLPLGIFAKEDKKIEEIRTLELSFASEHQLHPYDFSSRVLDGGSTS